MRIVAEFLGTIEIDAIRCGRLWIGAQRPGGCRATRLGVTEACNYNRRDSDIFQFNTQLDALLQ